MNTVLITGGAGAIGSVLANTLSADSTNHVIVLDDLSSGHVDNVIARQNVNIITGRVDSDEDLSVAFSRPINVIFHLAANFANQNSVDFPQHDLQVNGVGSLKLYLQAVKHGVRRLVYTSSSCVYGARNEALDERCREFSLDTPYAITKLLGEDYLRFFMHHHKLPGVIVRYFNVYGPNEYPGKYRNVIANFMYKALRGEDIVITGTGNETRDFNFVGDAVRATILASEAEEAIGEVVNVASGRETSVNHLVSMILAITGSRSRVVYRERRSWDSVVRRVAAVEKAKKLLKFEPKVDLETGIKAYFEWMVKQDLRKCNW